LTLSEFYAILPAVSFRGTGIMSARKVKATQEDLQNFKEEIVHQFHIVSEDIISQVKQVAEGVANVN
jgi:hypothetical protein